MPTITVTGSNKMYYRGKAYRPGQSFEMSDHDYAELKVDTELIKEIKEEIKTKPKKENEKLEN